MSGFSEEAYHALSSIAAAKVYEEWIREINAIVVQGNSDVDQ